MHRLFTILTATVVLTAGAALAHGPSGSYEGSKDHRTKNNNVRCAKGTKIDRMTIYAGQNGAEFCNDGGAMPVQGRLIVDARKQFVAADGDRNNPGASTGYVRIDSSGPHCGKGKDQDSTHSRTAGDPTTCDTN